MASAEAALGVLEVAAGAGHAAAAAPLPAGLSLASVPEASRDSEARPGSEGGAPKRKVTHKALRQEKLSRAHGRLKAKTMTTKILRGHLAGNATLSEIFDMQSLDPAKMPNIPQRRLPRDHVVGSDGTYSKASLVHKAVMARPEFESNAIDANIKSHVLNQRVDLRIEDAGMVATDRFITGRRAEIEKWQRAGRDHASRLPVQQTAPLAQSVRASPGCSCALGISDRGSGLCCAVARTRGALNLPNRRLPARAGGRLNPRRPQRGPRADPARAHQPRPRREREPGACHSSRAQILSNAWNGC
jgi:hypothetical protein